MFVILTGSSGVGKNTIIKELLSEREDIVMMPTFTTREKRKGEIEGSPYFYISKDEFQNKIKNNEFIEYEHIHNNLYGSSFNVFEEYIAKGKTIIKDIGVQGAQNLCVKLAGTTEIVKIFLTTKHKSDLKKRLKGREESQIKLRLKRYKYEQKQKNKFDFIIYNQNLAETICNISAILNIPQSEYLSCKKTGNISQYLVKYYKNKLLCGKTLKPIKISISDGKIYIVSGVEKFIASILAQKPVAKVLVSKNKKQAKCEQNLLENAQQLCK
jgi:guanylate kinase